MKPLPETEETLLIRTDFSSEVAWKTVCSESRMMDADVRRVLERSDEYNRAAGRPTGLPIEELGTPLHILDDQDYADATREQILSSLPPNYNSVHGFLFIADNECMKHPDHPLLVVDTYHERGRTFRAIPCQIFGIQSNLSLANMDWEEFSENVDEGGVFRGFR